MDSRLERIAESVPEKIEVLPETPRLRISEDVVLGSSPTKKGMAVLPIKKRTVVQKINEMKRYYLVYINGNCG